MKNNISIDDIEAILLNGGLPFKDTFSGFIGKTINEHMPDYRNRVFSPLVTTLGMVHEALDPKSSLSKTVININANRLANGESIASTNTAAYSKARSKLSCHILREGANKVYSNSVSTAPREWTWHGMKPKAIDGTTVTAADTDANQEIFPQHGKQEEGVGFPILRMVVLQCLITGMIIDGGCAPFKGKETGEMAIARVLLETIDASSLLIGDRYYPSYFFMCQLQERNIHGVFQSQAVRQIDFRTGTILGQRDHISTWKKPARPSWMSKEEYASFPSSLKIREVDITKEAGTVEPFIIFTTLLDNGKFTKEELSELYLQRWRIESALKDLKDTMGLGHIKAKTPRMIEKVIWSYFLAYNLIRWHMLNAAVIGETNPDKVSFTTTYNIIEANRSNILNSSKSTISRIQAAIYFQIIQVKVGQRPGRKEPRVVKKRPKPFPRMKAPRNEYKQKLYA